MTDKTTDPAAAPAPSASPATLRRDGAEIDLLFAMADETLGYLSMDEDAMGAAVRAFSDEDREDVRSMLFNQFSACLSRWQRLPSPASPATEDEALVDAFDEAAVACQAAADLASATALSERKETVRAALLDHLSALRRRAEEAEAEAERQRTFWEGIRDRRTDAAERSRDEARAESASLRAEVERLTRERECPKCAQEARSMAEADAWWNARPKCKCGRPTTDDGYGLRCLPCQEKIEACKCDSKKED